MTILQETAEIARETLGRRTESLRIERVVVGLFFTGVKLSNSAAGMSYTPVKEIPQAVCCPSSAGRTFDPVRLKGKAAEEILSALTSPEPIKTLFVTDRDGRPIGIIHIDDILKAGLNAK